MQVAFHIGAHCTDDDGLRKALERNADALAARGTAVPPPNRYRTLMRETVERLDGRPPAPETARALLDSILGGGEAARPERLVLANENFFCTIPRIFAGGAWYAGAGDRTKALASLFPGARPELFLALRNPATALPAIKRRAPDMDYATLMHGTDATTLRWSDLVRRLRAAMPDVPLTVWCNEDTPAIWPDLLRALAGVPWDEPMAGDNVLLKQLLSPEGMGRYRAYLAKHPPASAAQRRRIIGAFFDKFALPAATWEDADIPGWTDETVETLTAIYDEDAWEVANMDGVTFLGA
ncbi:hypothetical protein BCF33_1101 [Hasllibacter halocynthiae]|uniref:Sulfotransferase family protein n=1 Tax=Hasllibacter halocynthiae TaxID=595589 RepID=A0A2T0X952_9RHOB|nr:hypothetical protein [Hasllibacter halocynthiae]PRY95480.1 hypothetical protein BCF33_1101 [Hasllibacter halocynthiae]